MKSRTQTFVVAACAAAALAALSGCVVAPLGYDPAYAAPSGVVYVAPTYAVPGPGYAWHHHGRHGWGWRHPHNGWHRGWR